jgi:glycine/D-amino acid oxidase-like deaminating enzyme
MAFRFLLLFGFRIIHSIYFSCFNYSFTHLFIHSSRDIRIKRFPTVRLGPKQEAVFQKDTGMLSADVSVQAMLDIAEKRGAILHLDDAVVKIDRRTKTITTQKGQCCTSKYLVLGR